MKVKKVKWLGIFMVVAMLVALVPAVASVENDCGTCGEDGVLTVDLIAGQNDVVGTVTVTNDGEKVCVTYALNDDALAEGWLIYETHLYIGDGEFDGVLTRSNWRLGGPYEANPIPGQFPYGDDELDGEESWKFCISLEDLNVEIGDCLYIAAHAVIMRVDCVSDEFTPELSWQRSSEENVESFPGRGANWTLEQGFAIVQDPDEVVWDGGTDDQNDSRAGVNPAISYATWIYDYNDGSDHDGYADLRRFQATFDIPDGYSITGGKLASVNDGYGDIIPINDNIYIFMNESLQFWGGTIINVVGPTSFEGMAGALALRGGVVNNRDPAETDGWYIPGTFPAIDDDDFVVGENVLDVFAEEFSLWGAMHELALTLEYEECVWKDQTAWGDGDRFNEKGNWGMFFKYKICPPVECVPASIIFGVTGTGSTGGLYQIEITEEGAIVETLLKSIDNVGGATNFYPNGLAYDDVNHRLYFAIRKLGSSTANLYFWDFEDDSDIVLAATELPGDVYGATWGAGMYWYIPNGSNNMRTVSSFDADGTNGTVGMFEVNFAGGKSFNFGDIALDAEENVIYASTSFSGTNKEFFKYDMTKAAGERYSLITTVAADKAIGLQLGFGEDGVLYGHSTGALEWFAVDKAGTAESLGTGLNAYNDLASGPSVCVD